MNKYRAVKTGNFSSKFEAACHGVLLNRQDAGTISDIKCQQKVYLTDARILLIVDFSFTDLSTKLGVTRYLEAKGFETAVWRIKRRLWEFYGPGPLEIWHGSHSRPFLKEVIG